MLTTDKMIDQINVWEDFPCVRQSKKTFITISRQYGSEGWSLAKVLERKLNQESDFDPAWVSYNKDILKTLQQDKELINKLAAKLDLCSDKDIEIFFDTLLTEDFSKEIVFKKMVYVMKSLAYHGHVILLGRGANFITQDMGKGFHLRVIAPLKRRVVNIAKREKLSLSESEKLIIKDEKARETFIKNFFHTDVSNNEFYDLTINTAKINLEAAADMVIFSLRRLQLI